MLRASIALLGLLISPHATSAPLDPWKLACAHTRYSCVDVTPPTVLVTRTVEDGAYGTYHFGDDFIKVLPRLPTDQQIVVVAHEMVHYLQWVNGAKYESREDMCRLEHEAFDVSYAVSLDLWSPGTTWDDIHWVYGCFSTSTFLT